MCRRKPGDDPDHQRRVIETLSVLVQNGRGHTGIPLERAGGEQLAETLALLATDADEAPRDQLAVVGNAYRAGQ